jgi:hypothetical protein
LWFGFPYEPFSHTKFFRLTRVLDGMIKQHKGTKQPLREGVLRGHFKRIFQFIDSELDDPADIYVTRPIYGGSTHHDVARYLSTWRVRPHSAEPRVRTHGASSIQGALRCSCALPHTLRRSQLLRVRSRWAQG